MIFLAILFAPSYGQAQTALDTIEVSTARQLTPLRSALNHRTAPGYPASVHRVHARSVKHWSRSRPWTFVIAGRWISRSIRASAVVHRSDPGAGEWHQDDRSADRASPDESAHWPGDIQRAEVLESGGSRIYGPNAFPGDSSAHAGIRARPVAGHLVWRVIRLVPGGCAGQINTGSWFSYASVSGAQSDGYRSNTDFTYGMYGPRPASFGATGNC